MSIAEKKLPLEQAVKTAVALRDRFAPACHRVEIAGSVRRRRPAVNDLEIVAIPRMLPDLFGGDYGSALDVVLRECCTDGTLRYLKGGNRYRQFWISAVDAKLDLFLCRPEHWGVIFTQRTGSADFTHQLMTPRSRYTSTGRPGLLPSNFRVRRCRVWDGDQYLDTPEERDFFAAIGLPWVPPEDRH